MLGTILSGEIDIKTTLLVIEVFVAKKNIFLLIYWNKGLLIIWY